MEHENLTYKDWITLCFRTRAQCLFMPDMRCAPQNGDKLCRRCEERDLQLFDKLGLMMNNHSRFS